MVDELFGFLTGFGLYGWLGIGFIATGFLFTMFTAGWGFTIGGTLALIGFVLIGVDKLHNAIMDAVVDWIVSDARDMNEDAGPKLPRRRSLDFPSNDMYRREV